MADPRTLAANPLNWRVHTTRQREALEAIMAEIGWIDRVIVNANNGIIVDGHLRVSIAIQHDEAEVPVDYVDLTEDEEALALALFDTITAAAEHDADKYRALLQKTNTGNAALQQFLSDVAEEFGIVPEPSGLPPEDDGTLLKLFEVTMDEPRHQVASGQAYRLSGRHVLVCAEVLSGWSQWTRYLQGPEWLFCPYPGPFVVLGQKASTHQLLLVQPVPFICGHILDRYSEIHGKEAIEPVSR